MKPAIRARVMLCGLMVAMTGGPARADNTPPPALPPAPQAPGPAVPGPATPGGGPRLGIGMGVQVDLGGLLGSLAAAREPVHETGQLLVYWSDDDAAREGLAWLATRHARVPFERHRLDTLGGVLAVLQLTDEREALRLRDVLRREQPGWIVDLNARARPAQPTPSETPPRNTPPRLYALAMLGLAPPAAGAPTARLGVIDTMLGADGSTAGVASAGQLGTLEHRSFLAAGDTPSPPTHGRQVAMLIAGAPLANGFAGAAPPLALHWAGVMRRNGDRDSTHTVLLARALDWLAGREVRLVNFSGAGAGDEILRAVVLRLLERGIALVAAAGNTPDARAVYPAAYRGVWAITAVDAAGEVWAQASRGAHVGFAAPGVDLWVPEPAGSAEDASNGRYLSGTSFAAALASGALARLDAAFWQLDADARRARLCATARALAAPATGCGLLRVEAALLAGSSRP